MVENRKKASKRPLFGRYKKYPYFSDSLCSSALIGTEFTQIRPVGVELWS